MTLRNGIVVLLLLGGVLKSQSSIALLDIPNRTIPTDLRTAFLPEEVPCKLVNNFYLIAARIDGRAGYLILDTGAPDLVVNRPATGQHQEAASCTKEIVVGETTVGTLEWGGKITKNVPAYTLEMDHLSRSTGLPVLGLLGYEQLQEYEILLDYAAERLLLYPAARNDLHAHNEPKATLPFSLQSHLPIVEVRSAGTTYRFIIDTGAASNLMSPALYAALSEKAEATDKAELIGLDGLTQIVTKATVQGLTTAAFALPRLDYLVQDLSHLQPLANIRIDGLLGAPFLRTGVVSLNYAEKKLYMWR